MTNAEKIRMIALVLEEDAKLLDSVFARIEDCLNITIIPGEMDTIEENLKECLKLLSKVNL